MSLPLLSANAFQDLLDLIGGDDDRARADAAATHENPDDEARLEQQFFVDWEVPQAS